MNDDEFKKWIAEDSKETHALTGWPRLNREDLRIWFNHISSVGTHAERKAVRILAAYLERQLKQIHGDAYEKRNDSADSDSGKPDGNPGG